MIAWFIIISLCFMFAVFLLFVLAAVYMEEEEIRFGKWK